MLRIIEIFLCFWANGARRGGAIVALAFILAAIGAGWYAAGHLKVNTDTTKMLDTGLAFQQKAIELREAFPQIKDELSIIIRAETADEADAYASRLYDRLKARPDIITDAFSPANEPFFQDNGLLFLSEKELSTRLSNLTKAAGLIEALINDPGIDTLFTALADNNELAERSDLGDGTLDNIYNDLAAVIEDSLDGGNDPFSWRGALSEEAAPPRGYIAIVNAIPITDFSRIQPIKPAMEGIRTELSALDQEFDGRVKALITGSLALRGEELQSVTKGIGQSLLLSLVLVSILLVIAFRSVYVSILTIISLMISLTLTTAYAAYFFTELNLVSVAFTVLLVGLGLDFSIHLLLHVQEYRARGLNLRIALNSTMREIGGAMALAAPTTALAFLSFLPTSFDGIAQLGAVAGAGVIVAFFVSVTFLPAAIAATPAPKAKPLKGTIRRGLSFYDTIAMPIAILATLIGLAALVLLPKARFDADPMALRSQKSESVIAFNMLFDDENTVPYRLTRLTDSEEDAKATAKKAATLETVRATRSLADFVPDYQDEKLELIDFAGGSLAFVINKTPTPRTAPPTGDGVDKLADQLAKSLTQPNRSEAGINTRQRLLSALQNVQARVRGGEQAKSDMKLLPALEERVFAFWPELVVQLQRQFNADYIDYDTLPQSLKDRYLSADGKWRVDLLPALDVREPSNLHLYVNEVEEVFPDIGGGAIQSEKAGQIIAQSMLQASLLAIAVISIVLLVFVQKPVTVLLMLFPLGLAAILTIATGVLVNVPFNYANVIVLPLLMGIGIDSGIHLVLRQQKMLKSKAAKKDNVVSNVYGTATPRAVLFSALTTVASFGSLMLSEHRGTASMGQLLSIAIGFTLICTLVVLPAVFHFRQQRLNENS